jgi:2-oxoglutarate ferredoxin oxidoreductase subunit beta
MDYPEFPVPIGVFRDVDAPTFDQLVQQQVEEAIAKGKGSLEAALRAGETWVVE